MAKKTLTITLYMSELIYDVQNKAYLTGRSRSTGDNYEAVANMQANDDDENLNQVVRSIGNAFATLKTKVSEYMDDSGSTADNEQTDGESNLVVALRMPSNYNEGTRESVSAAMHQYIVNTALGDWLRITDKADAADYVNLASGNLEQLREALNKRLRPVRKASPNTSE